MTRRRPSLPLASRARARPPNARRYVELVFTLIFTCECLAKFFGFGLLARTRKDLRWVFQDLARLGLEHFGGEGNRAVDFVDPKHDAAHAIAHLKHFARHVHKRLRDLRDVQQALELAGVAIAGVSEKAELVALTREAVAAGPAGRR